MDWLDSPPCGGSYLEQQDACGELASFSDVAVCDAAVLCERDGAIPLPPPPPPPPSPTPSSAPSHPPPPLPSSPPLPLPPPPSPPLHPPLPPPPPSPPPPPPLPTPSPSPSTPRSLSPPLMVLPQPSYAPPPSSTPHLQNSPSSPLPASPLHSLLQLGATSPSSGAAPHSWSSALVAASCAAFFGFTCLLYRRLRCRPHSAVPASIDATRDKPVDIADICPSFCRVQILRDRLSTALTAATAAFHWRDAAKGATKANSNEEEADTEGEMLTPQRTRWLWAVHPGRWLSSLTSSTRAGRPSMADDQRLVSRGSESSVARGGAVTRSRTLAEVHGLD